MAKANMTLVVVAVLADGETRVTRFEADLRGARAKYDEEADGEDVLAVHLLRPEPHNSFALARSTTRG